MQLCPCPQHNARNLTGLLVKQCSILVYIVGTVQRREEHCSKASPVHAMKTYNESGGITPIILNLDASWR